MAAQTFTLLASAQFSTSGQGSGITIATATMLAVLVDITAVSGTTPDMDVYLQASADSGVTWHDLPLDLRQKTGETTVTANTRNIVDGAASVTMWCGIYKHLPAQLVRAAYDITGSYAAGEGFTFSVLGVAK